MNKDTRTVYAMGRRFDVLETIRIRGRQYYVVDNLGAGVRPRSLLVDPSGGGVLRVLLVLHNDSHAARMLTVLRALPKFGDLPRIIDVERRKDVIRLVVDYMPGRPVSDYLAAIRRGRVVRPTPYEAVRLVYQLSGALWSLHERAGLIHGDIKPANLILSRKSARLSLIDFGNSYCVERMAARLPGDGVTPVYSPPELQNREVRADGRIDQFSASVLLFELITLDAPYDGLGGLAGTAEYFDAFASHQLSLESEHEAFDLLPPKLKASLTQVVRRGLKLPIEERFPNTGTWRQELKHVLDALDQHRSSNTSTLSSIGILNWLTKFFIKGASA